VRIKRTEGRGRSSLSARYNTAVAPPIHFRRKLPLPTRYEIRTTVWYDIIRQVFSRLVESSTFETPPALLIRTLRKPPTHTWLRRACSRTCIHFKFNHVSTNHTSDPTPREVTTTIVSKAGKNDVCEMQLHKQTCPPSWELGGYATLQI